MTWMPARTWCASICASWKPCISCPNADGAWAEPIFTRSTISEPQKLRFKIFTKLRFKNLTKLRLLNLKNLMTTKKQRKYKQKK